MKHILFFQHFGFYLLPRWLRRKLKKWRAGFTGHTKGVIRTAVITVIVVGVLLGGRLQLTMAQEVIINNLERRTDTWEWQDISSSWEVTNTGTYSNYTPQAVGGIRYYSYGATSGNNGDNVIGALNSLSQGGTAVLSVIIPSSPTSPPDNDTPTDSPYYQYYYQNGWATNPSTTFAGGTVTINSGATILRNDRNGVSYIITELTKTGAGALTLSNNATAPALGSVYNSAIFNGYNGTLNVNTSYTSTTANVGWNGNTTTPVTGTFTGNVANGETWNTTTVDARGTFTKLGPGTLNSYDTTITGTSTLNGGNWWVTDSLQVGNGNTTGTLNITSGVMGASGTTGIPTVNIGNSSGTGTGSGTVRISSGATWLTHTTNIGNIGSGSVTNDSGNATTAGWTSSGKVTVGGSATNATGTVTNSGRMDWNDTADSLIGQVARGAVTNSGTWNTNNTVIVGAGPGGGSVTTSGTWNVGQSLSRLDVVVGRIGAGTVTQTGEAWYNRFTDVGDGAIGTVVQSGGTHNDEYAQIGNTTNGSYTLGGGSGVANWNTTEVIPGVPGVGAQIGVGKRVNGTVNVQSNGTWTVTNALTVGEEGNGYLNINAGTVSVTSGDVYVAKQDGSYGEVNISNGGRKTVGTATNHKNMYIAYERGTTGNVSIDNGTLTVHGNLITGYDSGTPNDNDKYSQGNLYASGGAMIIVDDDHIIADGINALGRDYIDGYGTTMNVGGTLTVGNQGQSGGTYTEDRSLDRYRDDPTDGDWRDSIHNRDLISVTNAKTGANTGNVPGLAVSRGAHVTSGKGVIGVGANSNGYVVIDNAGNTAAWWDVGYYITPVGTVYDPMENNPPYISGIGIVPNDPNGWSKYASIWNIEKDLIVGVDGDAFLRVLNGGVLVTGSDTSTPISTIISGGESRAQLFVSGNDADNGGRSVFKSYGATVVGESNKGRGTFRIYDGAFGETAGLYIGAEAGSEGEVFVGGEASTLRVMANTDTTYYHGNEILNANDRMQGTGLFGASHEALVWLDSDSAVRLNGCAAFTSGSILHLDNWFKDPLPTPLSRPFGEINSAHSPLFDAGLGRVNFVNARIEGIGTVTGANGVHFFQSVWDDPNEQATIDPGLIYGWADRNEKDFYGDLTFGHSLTMSGNVITYFDINSGYYDYLGTHDSSGIPYTDDSQRANQSPMQDNIYVVADPRNTVDPVTASPSGTLMIHARLSDYYPSTTEWYDIIQTTGQGGTGGIVNGLFEEVYIVPWRFFNDREQEIANVGGNDVLRIRMKLNETPFQDAAETYNQNSLASVLDSIYALRDQRWLPLLRSFWYLDDPEFLEEYRNFSGAVRVHSLLMPLQNPWTYAHSRNGFCRCTRDPIFGPQNRSCNIAGDHCLWGSFIHTNNWTNTDVNAGEYHLVRNGFVAGYERASKGGHSYLGAMFSYNQGKLDAWRAEAKSDDFQFGLYHGKTAWDTWEWKNYLGMGIQNYNMQRDIDLNLGRLTWNEDKQIYEYAVDPERNHIMSSDFLGLTFAASTEFARPIYFGKQSRWTVRPYMGFDLMALWQNKASEHGNKDDTYKVNGKDYLVADLVAMNYHSATNVRVYGRPGVMFERGGPRGNLRMGLSYSYLMGGRRYTNVDNQFQFAGESFNIRGVDDGSGFVTGNFGAGVYLGRRKLCMVCLDYSILAGSYSTTHAGQLGLQRIF